MNALERARDLVRKYPFRDLAKLGEEPGSFADEHARGWYWDGDRSRMFREMDADTLARSLHTVLEIDERRITDEGGVSLGVSKLKGLPHLPRSMAWPKKTYFLAQVALAEVAAHDVEDLLPKRGMLYFFTSLDDECRVIHFDGDLAELELRAYPEEKPPEAEHYLDDFLRESARVSFSPRYLFYAGGGDAFDYSRSAAVIPPDLREALDAALPGFSLAARDVSLRLFGRPHFWQGEDEAFEDEDEHDEPVDAALLFQDEFGEGNLHIWVDRAKAAQRDYSGCWMTYSGT